MVYLCKVLYGSGSKIIHLIFMCFPLITEIFYIVTLKWSMKIVFTFGAKAEIQQYFTPCGVISHFTLYIRAEIFICMNWIERHSLVKQQEFEFCLTLSHERSRFIINLKFFSFNNFIWLFLIVLSLHCCADFFLVAIHRLLTVVVSLVEEHGLYRVWGLQ